MGSPRLAVAAITIDFGNTLVMVDQPSLRAVVQHTGAALAAQGIVTDLEGFMSAWIEERERQFREDIPEYREPDIELRAVRVLARLRGFPRPPDHERWDDVAAAELVEPDEVAAVAEAYGAEFVSRMDSVADATATLERLERPWLRPRDPVELAARRHHRPFRGGARLAAVPAGDRRVAARRLDQATPTDLPRRGELRSGCSEGSGGAILHVGDDWAADVVGASQAGWRAAYLRVGRPTRRCRPRSRAMAWSAA